MINTYKPQLTLSGMILAFSAMLFACGGGGGGSGNDGDSGYSLTITADNAQEVVHLAHSAMNLLEGLGSIGSGFSSAYEFLINLEPGIPAAYFCSHNYSEPGLTATWSDKDSNGIISSGDVFTIDFSNCDDPFYEWYLNGEVVLTLISQTGIQFGVPSAMRATLRFNQLQVYTYKLTNITISGEHTIDFDDDSFDVSGTSLNITGAFANGISFDVMLKDYSYGYLLDLNSPLPYDYDYSWQAAGVMIANKISDGTNQYSGSVSLKTLTPFAGTGAEQPSAGALKITGADSSVTLTALDKGKARIDTDLGDDGSVDASIEVLWNDVFF